MPRPLRANPGSRTPKMLLEPRRFRAEVRHGELLAIEPRAIDFSYLYTGQVPNERTEDGVAIVTVNGPLEHHSTVCWDSYEAICARVEAAVTGEDVSVAHALGNWWREDFEPLAPVPCRAVVLKIDSPGGEAAGATWGYRRLRAIRKAAGVPFYAYANETACSAAYEIACAADEIWLPDTGTVGSIGVIATLFDRTEQNAKMGLNVELVTSGAYKADNHADREIDDGVRERMADRVESFAEVFYGVVARSRSRATGMLVTPDAVRALEAGVFVGADAVSVGVADGVATFEAFLEMVTDSLPDVAEASPTDTPAPAVAGAP